MEGIVTCDIAGGELVTIRKQGLGVPVIFLHGNSSCKETFRDLWRVLSSRGRELVACDLPGHGASKNAADTQARYTLPGYAEAVKELLDWGGWQRAILLGWSLGGHIAMETMISDSRVTACMVIGSPPGKPSAEAIEVVRGSSAKPLYITAAGITSEAAAAHVRAMHGPFRIPTLIALADALCRAS